LSYWKWSNYIYTINLWLKEIQIKFPFSVPIFKMNFWFNLRTLTTTREFEVRVPQN
jgi:hypothetical protein